MKTYLMTLIDVLSKHADMSREKLTQPKTRGEI